MDGQLFAFTILLFLAGIFYIASTAIGIQCMNANEKYKIEQTSNSGFLISQLVSAILVTILAMLGMYLSFKK
jgi:hypothetical protein